MFDGDNFIYQTIDSLKISLDAPLDLMELEPFDVLSEANRAADEILSYNWSPNDHVNCENCPAVTALFAEEGVLTLVVRDIYGCIDSAYVDVMVGFVIKLFIPNAFSPNDDNLNDYFEAYGNSNVQEVLSIKVFDRWGNQVFAQTEGTPKRWNGVVNGKEAPSGLYAYHLTFLGRDDKVYARSGSVQLIR